MVWIRPGLWARLLFSTTWKRLVPNRMLVLGAGSLQDASRRVAAEPFFQSQLQVGRFHVGTLT